jgi:hypothetical protein
VEQSIKRPTNCSFNGPVGFPASKVWIPLKSDGVTSRKVQQSSTLVVLNPTLRSSFKYYHLSSGFYGFHHQRFREHRSS